MRVFSALQILPLRMQIRDRGSSAIYQFLERGQNILDSIVTLLLRKKSSNLEVFFRVAGLECKNIRLKNISLKGHSPKSLPRKDECILRRINDDRVAKYKIDYIA